MYISPDGQKFSNVSAAQQHASRNGGSSAPALDAREPRSATTHISQQHTLGAPNEGGREKSKSDAGGGANGWRQYTAPDGRRYYHHKASKTTQWAPPPGWAGNEKSERSESNLGSPAVAQNTEPAGAQAGVATTSNGTERERRLEKDKRPQERRSKSPARSRLRSSDLDRRDRDRDRDRDRSRDRDRDRGRGASPGRRAVQRDARPQGHVRGGRARSVSPLLRHRQGRDREWSRGRSRERSRGRSRGRSRERSYERAREYPGRVWERGRVRSRSPERRERSVGARDRNLGRDGGREKDRGSGEALGSKRPVRASSFASSGALVRSKQASKKMRKRQTAALALACFLGKLPRWERCRGSNAA